MVRLVPVRDRPAAGRVVGKLLGRPAADLGGDAQIGIDGQVRTVVLECGDRDDGDPILGGRAADLGQVSRSYSSGLDHIGFRSSRSGGPPFWPAVQSSAIRSIGSGVWAGRPRPFRRDPGYPGVHGLRFPHARPTHPDPPRSARSATAVTATGPSKKNSGRTCSTGSAAGDALFPAIVGYEDSVVPALERGILAGHDLILLGERGQAKTRLIRHLVDLLDEVTPVIAGCEVNDHPYRPICARCRALVADKGDATPIAWLPRDRRYAEKLATPDASVADLIGDVDPIRVAEGRYLSDELTIHYGLIPRTNRGIVAINELPDLPERIQVALFNILEERDVQIRGYQVRLPLDLLLVATANPEDYTHRGPHRVAAQGPVRHAGPDALPRDAGRRDLDHGAGGAPPGGRRADPGPRPRVHEGDPRRADRGAAAFAAGQPAQRRVGPVLDREPRDAGRGGGPPRGRAPASPRPSRASSTFRPCWPARPGGSSSTPSRRAARRRSCRAPAARRCSRSSAGACRGSTSARCSSGSTTALASRPRTSCPARRSSSSSARRRASAKLLGRLGVEEESPGVAASALEFALEGLHLSRRLNKDAAGPSGAVRYDAV